MYLKKFVALLSTLFTLSCAEEPLPMVSEDSITALMACVMVNRCRGAERTIEMVRGEVITGVKIKNADVHVKYFFTDQNRFGVSWTLPDKKQLLLEDNDLDGRVDRITETVDRPDGMVIVYGPEVRERYVRGQEMYVKAMKIAEKLLIPPELQDALKSMPKGVPM